jgi:hypothetical protein
MGNRFKLQRPIRNAADTEDINEVTMKDEDSVSASDFYNIEIPTGDEIRFGQMASLIGDLCGLTDSQVASLHIKDYLKLNEVAASFLE